VKVCIGYYANRKKGRYMKRFLIVVIVVSAMAVLSVIFTQTASSNGKYNSKGGVGSQFFIGLWGGVDPNDGSDVLVSISDNDDDGRLELLWHESRWFSCGGTDNAVFNATGGTVQDGVLSFETATLTCFKPYVVTNVPSYALESNRKANTIFDPNDNIILHRISSRR
jgi:hypothetical protein